jgi:hypothetical protein
MLLDLVLSEPEHDWFATEADKVDLFVNRLGVPVQALPHRTYESKKTANTANSTNTPNSANSANTTHTPSLVTTRYCVQKLAVFLEGDPARVHFVCLVTEPKAREVEAFIADHARLLSHLDAWTLVAAGPQAVVHEDACASAFARGLAAITNTPRLDSAAVEAYFRMRRAVEREEFSALSVEDLRRFRDCHARWGGALSVQYTHWLQHGSIAVATTHLQPRHGSSGGILITRPLPHSYSQFGSTPGIA